MTRRNLTIRRETNRKLGEAEAKARCASCHGPLPEIGVHVLWMRNDGRKFCSEDCLEDFRTSTRTER